MTTHDFLVRSGRHVRMLGRILLLAACASLGSARAVADELRLLAVLPLDARAADIDEAARMTLEETLRSIAGRSVNRLGYTVLTNETMLQVLRDNGVDPDEACSDTSCDLDVAREISASLFLGGRVTTVNGRHFAFIRLYETANGRQISDLEISGESVLDLRDQIRDNAGRLFRVLGRKSAVPTTERRIIAEGTGADRSGLEDAVTVAFDSDPKGAVVFVDGELVCQSTPCTRYIETGTHEASMQREQHLPGFQTFEAKTGARVSLKLEPTYGTLEVATEPSGLTVDVSAGRGGDDKVLYSRTSPFSLHLDPDVYTLKLSTTCHLRDGATVVIGRGSRRKERIVARPRMGLVRVLAETTEKNALSGKVSVDGIPLGETGRWFDVPICAREISLSTNDGRRWSDRLRLTEGERKEILAVVRTAAARPQERNLHAISNDEPLQVPQWVWWTAGGAGALTWAVAGIGALSTQASLQQLPAGDPAVASGMSRGQALVVVSNIGAVVLASAIIGGIWTSQ